MKIVKSSGKPIDVEYEEVNTVENRVSTIEGQIQILFEQHKNILEQFREMIKATIECSTTNLEE